MSDRQASIASGLTGRDGRAWALGLLAACAAVFAYLLHRNFGLNPSIFADEWHYSKMARLMPLRDAMVPSYLYLWLSRGSNACGASFLDCVRVGNALFFVGAAPFVYLAAREYCARPAAAGVALLALLAPANVYTAFFMPESAYWFGFCVLGWIVLARGHWGRVRQPLAAGAVLGLMSLVKVHALFLLPALCLFLLYASWLHAAGWRAGLLPMAVAAAALFAVRFGLGYALAGKAALSLFGPFYGDAAGSAAGHTLPALLAAAWVSARGHLMALALLAALPLALLAQALAALFGGDRAARPTPLQAWTLLTLAAAAGMTVLYTASLAGAGTEGLRLHLRYYSFVFPLLWMVAAAAPARPAALRARALRWAAALLVALLLAGALVKLPGYAPNLVDGPELFPLRLDTAPGLALVALELLVLLLWAMGSRAARQLFLLAAVPATIAGGIAGNSAYLAQQRMPLDADKGGKFARAVVPVSERGRITVAGSDPQHLLRAQFHIDDKDSVLLMLPDGAPIAPYQLPVRNKWLLVLGKHALPPGLAPLAQTPDYVLARVGGAHRTIGRAALSAPFGSGLIASTEGLSHAESWGRWSDAKRVVIHFNAPLPRHLNVILTAQAFADNAALPFTMHVGDAAASFRVSGAAQELGLHFDTDGSARSLAIDVPHPVSPAELGQPNDARTLGIGIIDIEIGEGTAAPRSWRAGLPR